MYGHGKSDRPICTKEAAEQRQVRLLLAEAVEGRGLAKGNLFRPNKCRTQGRKGFEMNALQNALERIRQAACRDRRMRFTALRKVHCFSANHRQATESQTQGPQR